MIDVPTADIIAKVKEQKGLSEEEIRKRIDEKLKQLAGLISEQGAAHIIANELGVELVKEGGGKIRDLYPGMRNVTIPARVTRKFEVREFDKDGRKGKVANAMIGDETGQVRITLWNEQTDIFKELNEGDVVRVKNAFVRENRGYKELHLNQDSEVEVRPEGVTVDVAQPRQRERKTIKELSGDEENVELLATVVQLYDPRFFEVCPECGKRVNETEQGAACPEHGSVQPQTNYVVSAFLDDGTGTIRTTFWKNQSMRLLDKTDEEMLAYRDNTSAFQDVKTDMLGEIIKVVGRCKRNETFDRIELTANLIFRNVDPEEELARLKEGSKENVESLNASEQTKEQIAETLDEKPAAKTEVDEQVEDVIDESDADPISLDDLDEKL